jgi:uncharacterized protein (DUF1501 family)
MFDIEGQTHRYCDGVSRRSVLKIGSMGIAGLTLSDLFRAEARAGIEGSRKAIINIHLGGGPSHTDMFDLKPDAPSEYRGEFSPIKTNVPGFEICELMPRLAKMADKFSVVRSVVGTYPDHSHVHTQSGYSERELKSVGGFPSIGSVIAKLQGPNDGATPFVSMHGDMPYGFLGPSYKSYAIEGAHGDLKLGRISAQRMRDRAGLLTSLDTLRRDVDRTGSMAALDKFTQKAVDVVISGKMAEAVDLTKESNETRQRYLGGGNDRRNDNERLLLARRLVEAGVRCVTFSWGGWDTHTDNFKTLRTQLPELDAGMSALIQDLHDRGMDKDVSIVMWGEFGRSPRIANNAGRDHWPPVMQAFLAGGGMKMGQVIGSTDRVGGEAKDRPIHLREIFATLYHNMGIDAKNTSIIDPAGRPQYLVDDRNPIRELI